MYTNDPKLRHHDQCRLLLLYGNSVLVEVLHDKPSLQLPRISIPSRVRPTERLQLSAQCRWSMKIFVIDFLEAARDYPPCAVAEVLSYEIDSCLVGIELEELDLCELKTQEKVAVHEIINGHSRSRGPFCRTGWLLETINWARSAVEPKSELTGEFRQFNATGHFSLIRFSSINGPACWLKATGEPNRHEYPLTERLSQLCPEGLPPRIAGRSDWNAWLMEDAGEPCVVWDRQKLERATQTLAIIQQKTIGHTNELLVAGGYDLRISGIRLHIRSLFAYLDEIMPRQTSTRSPLIDAGRLSEMESMVSDACGCMENLGIPNTVVHHDLNKENVLFEGARCVLTDWCEAGVGNPILSCQSLWSHQEAAAREWLPSLHWTAKQGWIDYLSEKQIDTALTLAPLLSMLICLYGRGTWLHSPLQNHPSILGYKRTIARRMDRACRDPRLVEALCR